MDPTNPKPIQDSNQPHLNAETGNSKELIETEIEHQIPVKDQSVHNSGGNSSPNSSVAKQFVEEHDEKSDKDLEKVLKDVNKDVKNTVNKIAKPSFMSKLFKSKPKVKSAPVHPAPAPAQAVNTNAAPKDRPKTPSKTSSTPFAAICIALVVAIILTAAAINAFSGNKNPSKDNSANNTPTSQNSTTTKKVTANDIYDLSSNLKSQLDTLNDAQDFNSTDLSDSNLGL